MNFIHNSSVGSIGMPFRLNIESQAFELDVYNLAGKVVLRQKSMGIKGANNVSIQMDDLKPGIYFMEVRSDQMKARKRVVLQK